MIYTLTLNPAIDYILYPDEFEKGSISRSRKEKVYYGGKGINVSLVLKELGKTSVAMGFLAGFTGIQIKSYLEEKSVACDFVFLKEGFTRINVKIRSNQETDINAKGPKASRDEINLLLEKIDKLTDKDTLIVAGSSADGMDIKDFEQILDKAKKNGVRLICDLSGQLLKCCIKYKPYLIKPNEQEIFELLGRKVNNQDLSEAIKPLFKQGVQNVLVSLGKNGSVFVSQNGEKHFVEAIEGKVVNTVGAGDSMVAGFTAGLDENRDILYCLNLANACASATAFCEGLADRENIEKLIKK